MIPLHEFMNTCLAPFLEWQHEDEILNTDTEQKCFHINYMELFRAHVPVYKFIPLAATVM